MAVTVLSFLTVTGFLALATQAMANPNYMLEMVGMDCEQATNKLNSYELDAINDCLNTQMKLINESWARYKAENPLLLTDGRRTELSNILKKLKAEYKKNQAIATENYNKYYKKSDLHTWYYKEIEWLNQKNEYNTNVINVYNQGIIENNEAKANHKEAQAIKEPQETHDQPHGDPTPEHAPPPTTPAHGRGGADGICDDYAADAWRAYEKAHEYAEKANTELENQAKTWHYRSQQAIRYAQEGDQAIAEGRRAVEQARQSADNAYTYAEQAREICNKIPPLRLHGTSNLQHVERMRNQARNAAGNAETARDNAKSMRQNASNFGFRAGSLYLDAWGAEQTKN